MLYYVLVALLSSASALYTDFEQQEKLSEKPTGNMPVLNGGQSDWDLVYAEDFRTTSLDLEHFNVAEGSGCDLQICGWGNGEIQRYSKKAVSVADGRLSISATKYRDITTAEREKNRQFWLRNDSDYTTTWTSGRLTTKGKVQGRYGLISFTARLPTGKGVWPALWLLPTNDTLRWPEGGEIDVVEYNQLWNPFVTPGTIHFPVPGQQGSGMATYNSTDVPNAGFNEYSVLWTPAAITFIRDGMSIGTYQKKDNIWPFDDNAFHLILNIAISPFWGDLPDVDVSSFRMDVDSIRWWQRRSYKKWNNRQTRKMGVLVPGLPDFL